MPSKNSGGLVALTVALALVASLLYAQPLIRADGGGTAGRRRRGAPPLHPRPIESKRNWFENFTGW